MWAALMLAAVLAQGKDKLATHSAPPIMTDVEALTVQNFNLRTALINDMLAQSVSLQTQAQHAQTDLNKEIAAFRTQLELSHPGWIWNPTDGLWTKKPPATSGKSEWKHP